MTPTSEPPVLLHRRIKRMCEKCRVARNEAKCKIRKVMLAGKVKAYVDVLCMMEQFHPSLKK